MKRAEPKDSTEKVVVGEHDGTVTIENHLVKINYSLSRGTYNAVDKRDNSISILDAYAQLGDLASNQAGIRHSWKGSPLDDELGKGKTLTITSSKTGQPNLLLAISLYDGQGHIILAAGIKNTTDSVVQLKQIIPLVAGRIFKSFDLRKNFSMLDGCGGGNPTSVTHDYNRYSRNNLLVTFGDSGRKRSLVIGGLTYNDFEKFAEAQQDRIIPTSHGQSLLCYLNLPEKEVVGKGGAPILRLIQGSPYKFPVNTIHQCFSSIVLDSDEVVLEATGLEPEKNYRLGFSWWDDGSSRIESVLTDSGSGTRQHMLLEKKSLPPCSGNPEAILLTLPAKSYHTGKIRIVFKKDSGYDAVLSEVWLCECAKPAEPITITKATCDFGKKAPIALNIQLSALDSIGKRVDPGVRYLPDDRFYIDFMTDNPFEALEKYAFSIRAAQKIKLNVYNFPTVCLWYAYCYNKQSAKNDSPGAVAEMDKIVQSGFLKYSKVAVRLVPDDYEEYNQNGWWDDEHWQRVHAYNESDIDTSVTPYKYVYKPGLSEPGSYKKPYETTEKWGKAVTERGGIPLTYFQTNWRSQDYAEAFPCHMLFNKANAPVLDEDGKPKKHGVAWKWNAWKSGKVVKHGYDHSDPGFIQHMREVYANLRAGGVRGLMFDYPSHGWANDGGMEDKYATAAWAYRNIFKLAYEGLGPDCYIHERNLVIGADVTAGVVTSQRIWEDSDLLKPEMVARGGLRWYKNRVVFNYDMDGKSLHRADPNNSDGPWDKKPLKSKYNPKSRYRVQALLTMCYVSSSRLLLATSFGRTAKEYLFDVSRLYPSHIEPKSARPVDAFTNKFPSVYDFQVDSQWHQLTFYNWKEKAQIIGVDMSGNTAFGALGLDAKKSYYVYDFWNDRLVGKFSGSARLEQKLRPGEARMMSIHQAVNHPQIISTNRHIMQGYVDLLRNKWDVSKNQLSGTSKIIGKETYKVIIATNGYKPRVSTAVDTSSRIRMLPGKDGLVELSLKRSENAVVDWAVMFSL